MGYESRIIVVNVVEYPEKIVGNAVFPKFSYVEEIASIKMGCMEQGFHQLFDKAIDYKIGTPDFEEKETDKDRYGCHIKSGDISRIIQWIEDKVREDNYRRLKPLLGFLKGFDTKQWDRLEVLYYGY